MPFHFEGKLHDVRGVLKLALPRAGLDHVGGFDLVGIRTDTDQVVGPHVGTHLPRRFCTSGAPALIHSTGQFSRLAPYILHTLP